MKTALESLDALEALARRMAKTDIDRYAIANPDCLIYAKASIFLDARAIVSELPDQVSADTLEARALVAKCARWFSSDPEIANRIEGGKWDNSTADLVQSISAALRRAREEGVK